MSQIIPTYALYGELLAGTLSDPVHLETIQERSSQLDWTIRVHRHSQLSQIFILRSPGVRLQIGEDTHQTTGPIALLVPPGVAHGFHFPDGMNGDVLSLPGPLTDPDLIEKLTRAAQQSGGLLPGDHRAFADMEALLQQIRRAYHGLGPERQALLTALSESLCLHLIEALLESVDTASLRRADQHEMTRPEHLAQRFCELVETHFQEAWTVGDYAAALGLSAPHLTRLCRQVLQTAPNDLVRQRRLLEAKRLLSYTRLSVADVAFRAGFNDPAFFNRSFKAALGVTPGAWRKAHQ